MPPLVTAKGLIALFTELFLTQSHNINEAIVCVFCVYLDKDLSSKLVWWREFLRVTVHWLGKQQISKHLLKVRGHIPLLDHTAVVLYGQDHWIPV